jgi:ABC-type nickel/cobalt efflux system permease component RcnA
MIEILGNLWGLLVRIAADLGALWQTATVALLLSLALTQWAKPWVARIADADVKRLAIQALAFAAGCLPVVAAHPDRAGVVAGLLVGIASPLIYQVAAWALWRRWPDLADALSADSPTTVREAVTRKRKPPKERAP